MDLVKILRQRQRRAAKLHTPRHSRRDALRLTAADILPLRLGHKGQDLQDQIGDKRPHQVASVPGIQQRHVDDTDIHPSFFGQDAPLLLDVLIVAA